MNKEQKFLVQHHNSKYLWTIVLLIGFTFFSQSCIKKEIQMENSNTQINKDELKTKLNELQYKAPRSVRLKDHLIMNIGIL